MATITLAEVKEHLRIDADFEDDDNYITSLIDVAKEMACKHLNIKSFAQAFGDGEIPSPIAHAMKVYIADLYNNREATTDKASVKRELNYEYLLSMYRKY